MTISKKEIKYIIYAGIFGFILFGLVIPHFLNSIEKQSPFLQFMLFNISIFIFLQIYLRAKSLSTGIDIKRSISTILFVMALDVWLPPLMLSPSGTLLSGPLIIGGASDYIIALFGQSLGLQGFILFLGTYFVAPTLLLLASARISDNNFLRN